MAVGLNTFECSLGQYLSTPQMIRARPVWVEGLLDIVPIDNAREFRVANLQRAGRASIHNGKGDTVTGHGGKPIVRVGATAASAVGRSRGRAVASPSHSDAQTYFFLL